MDYNRRHLVTIGDHKEKLLLGVQFNYLGFYANGHPHPEGMYSGYPNRWHVERVIDRGIVVSHPHNKCHQHLLEYNHPIAKIQFA